MEAHGPKTVLFSDRGGPFRDLHQAFMRGLGSPNYSNHDSACARNVQHAALSVFGFGRKDVVYDYKNARHVVLQTRNIFEAINVKEVNDLMAGMARRLQTDGHRHSGQHFGHQGGPVSAHPPRHGLCLEPGGHP